MTLSTLAAGPDLLRLVAVPVFAWVAYRDLQTRRVSSEIWIPLSTLGVVGLVWDGWRAWQISGQGSDSAIWFESFLLPTAVSLGIVVPLAYLFWWVGGFGGADAKALLTLAVLFPTFPEYVLGSWTMPLASTPIGAFSFTILTNAVLIGLAIPLVLAIRNAAAGRIAPVMVIGWPVSWSRIPRAHGILLETPEGRTRDGLDLDALRMYLRWRGVTLEAVRSNPAYYRDPSTVPSDPNRPTDGAVDVETRIVSGKSSASESTESKPDETAVVNATEERTGSTKTDAGVPRSATIDDPWGADAFLEDIERSAYGTSPETLRDGLEALVSKETVWISPGTPFLVPIFLGLGIALIYGDLLFGPVL